MIHSLTELSPSARLWGSLWGDRPRDWAGNEEQQLPVYEAALERTGVRPGDRVLDVGCGTGVFLRLCADRGADLTRLDANENHLYVARRRVPEAELSERSPRGRGRPRGCPRRRRGGGRSGEGS